MKSQVNIPCLTQSAYATFEANFCRQIVAWVDVAISLVDSINYHIKSEDDYTTHIHNHPVLHAKSFDKINSAYSKFKKIHARFKTLLSDSKIDMISYCNYWLITDLNIRTLLKNFADECRYLDLETLRQAIEIWGDSVGNITYSVNYNIYKKIQENCQALRASLEYLHQLLNTDLLPLQVVLFKNCGSKSKQKLAEFVNNLTGIQKPITLDVNEDVYQSQLQIQIQHLPYATPASSPTALSDVNITNDCNLYITTTQDYLTSVNFLQILQPYMDTPTYFNLGLASHHFHTLLLGGIVRNTLMSSDFLAELACYLDLPTFARLARLSKRFRNVINSGDRIWQYFVNKRFFCQFENIMLERSIYSSLSKGNHATHLYSFKNYYKELHNYYKGLTRTFFSEECTLSEEILEIPPISSFIEFHNLLSAEEKLILGNFLKELKNIEYTEKYNKQIVNIQNHSVEFINLYLQRSQITDKEYLTIKYKYNIMNGVNKTIHDLISDEIDFLKVAILCIAYNNKDLWVSLLEINNRKQIIDLANSKTFKENFISLKISLEIIKKIIFYNRIDFLNFILVNLENILHPEDKENFLIKSLRFSVTSGNLKAFEILSDTVKLYPNIDLLTVINSRNKKNVPLLLNVIKARKLNMAYFLISKEANIYETDYQNNTALHYAAAANFPSLMLELSHRGLNLEQMNNNDQTALSIAMAKKYTSLIEIIKPSFVKLSPVIYFIALNNPTYATLHFNANFYSEAIKQTKSSQELITPEQTNEIFLALKIYYRDRHNNNSNLATKAYHYFMRVLASHRLMNKDGLQIIHFAIQNSWINAVCSLLLAEHSQINLVTQAGDDCLQLALKSKQREVFLLLNLFIKNCINGKINISSLNNGFEANAEPEHVPLVEFYECYYQHTSLTNAILNFLDQKIFLNYSQNHTQDEMLKNKYILKSLANVFKENKFDEKSIQEKVHFIKNVIEMLNKQSSNSLGLFGKIKFSSVGQWVEKNTVDCSQLSINNLRPSTAQCISDYLNDVILPELEHPYSWLNRYEKQKAPHLAQSDSLYLNLN